MTRRQKKEKNKIKLAIVKDYICIYDLNKASFHKEKVLYVLKHSKNTYKVIDLESPELSLLIHKSKIKEFI